MNTEANKALVRRYLEEIINQGNFAVAEEILAPAYVNHTVGGGICRQPHRPHPRAHR